MDWLIFFGILEYLIGGFFIALHNEGIEDYYFNRRIKPEHRWIFKFGGTWSDYLEFVLWMLFWPYFYISAVVLEFLAKKFYGNL